MFLNCLQIFASVWLTFSLSVALWPWSLFAFIDLLCLVLATIFSCIISSSDFFFSSYLFFLAVCLSHLMIFLINVMSQCHRLRSLLSFYEKLSEEENLMEWYNYNNKKQLVLEYGSLTRILSTMHTLAEYYMQVKYILDFQHKILGGIWTLDLQPIIAITICSCAILSSSVCHPDLQEDSSYSICNRAKCLWKLNNYYLASGVMETDALTAENIGWLLMARGGGCAKFFF